ncbi:hypothetical protein KC571_00360 [candidate division WWE3 bacterium]|uniref:Uncharacterized protein n=1 Tax=candidate division WWE3 bacterium TaxID=2053526 RepID=A0A955LG77_UNCKA|nr:hypothetical protein [candidate division WWE3 bacterium]
MAIYWAKAEVIQLYTDTDGDEMYVLAYDHPNIPPGSNGHFVINSDFERSLQVGDKLEALVGGSNPGQLRRR